MPKVTAIPAKKPKLMTQEGKVRKLRVAGYARVSTDEEEQLNSYEAQLEYYENKIKSNPDWEFVQMYADEGITATNNKKRDGFNDMVKDALDGKIDRILTKSISRFARNTVVSLTTIRQLKEKGIGIYFEKENIDTLDAKGELLITIMSSLAQEESRSISENVLWGTRKKMADGKFTLAYSHFLGYDKGEDILLIITTLDDSGRLEKSRDEICNEIEVVVQIMESLIKENSTKALDQTAYAQRYDELAKQYEDASLRLEDIEIKLAESKTRKDTLEKFVAGLDSGYKGEFDEDLFYTMVETITVFSKDRITVLLKCGTEIEVSL